MDFVPVVLSHWYSSMPRQGKVRFGHILHLWSIVQTTVVKSHHINNGRWNVSSQRLKHKHKMAPVMKQNRVRLQRGHKAKVRLTPNMIFGMCNIWVIRRRNVIYLYSKKPHLDQRFHCQSSRYAVIRWIFGTKKQRKTNLQFTRWHHIRKRWQWKSWSRRDFLL